jgi:PAS domain-containing protein
MSSDRLELLIGFLLDTMVEGVAVANDKGEFVFWNEAARRIIGLGPQDVPPERWSEVYGIYEDETCKTMLKAEDLPLHKAIQGKTAINQKIYICNVASGIKKYVFVTAKPMIGSQGEVLGGMCVFYEDRLTHSESSAVREKLKSDWIASVRLSGQIDAKIAEYDKDKKPGQ